MRGLRSFIGLFVVLIALGAYLYFVESRRDPLDTGETRPKVFAVQPDQIEELTVRSESGERTSLKKNGGEWQIVDPVEARADASEVSGITSNLSTLEEQRLIDENPGNLADFGLGEPRIEVAFKAAGQEHRLLVGSKTPTGGDIYARTAAAPRVFLIPSFVESTFNRTTFDLRDKTALTFDRDAADRIEIVTANRTLAFAKRDGQWQIAQPAGARSDTAAIEGLLARLHSLQMKSVVGAETAAGGKLGLGSPAATVRIGSGSSEATLLVGAPAEDGTVYAKDASRPAVFTLESSLLDELKKDAGEYRQKDIFDARAFNTTRIEITRGGETLTFERKDGKWQQTAPAGRQADTAKVDALLSALTSARADAFVDAAPRDAKAELTAVLHSNDGARQERVTFSRGGSDAFAQRPDMSGAARLTASTLDSIVQAVEALE